MGLDHLRLGLLLVSLLGACAESSAKRDGGAVLDGATLGDAMLDHDPLDGAVEGGQSVDVVDGGNDGGADDGGDADAAWDGGEPDGAAPSPVCAEAIESHTSGTRLRARYAVTSEGDRAWMGWYDSERQEECKVTLASDGTLRCMPTGRHAAYYDFFADDQCGQRFAYRSCLAKPIEHLSIDRFEYPSDNCEGERLYTDWSAGSLDCADPDVIHIPSETCPILTRVLERGARPEAIYHLNHDDGGEFCEGSANGADRHWFYYQAGAELPAESFVAVRLDLAEDPGRLKRVVRTGEDGSCSLDGWYDTKLDTPCQFELMTDGALHCIPWPIPRYAYEETLFTDQDCTEEWATIAQPEDPCVQAKYSISSSAECGQSVYSVRTVENTLDVSAIPPVWSDRTGVCKIAWGYDATSVVLSAKKDPSDFMAAEIEVE